MAVVRRPRGSLRRADARRQAGYAFGQRAASLCKRMPCIRIDCRLNGVGAYILVYNYVIGVEGALCRAPGKRSWLMLAIHYGKVRPGILLRLSSPDRTRPWPPRGGTCMVFVVFELLSSALRFRHRTTILRGSSNEHPCIRQRLRKFSYAPRPGPDEDSKANGRLTQKRSTLSALSPTSIAFPVLHSSLSL
jgi:hypothetical protein